MPENYRSASEIRQYRRLVRKIVRHHFGNEPTRIVHKATGLSNYVFAINHVQGQFVIRISPDPEKIDAFRKEYWATLKVREAGVPTPEILEVGNEIIPEPYMITRRVSGEEATHHPKRLSIIREIGRYASIINSIPTVGFGSYFEWSIEGATAGKAWKDYVEKEWELDKKLDILTKQKMLTSTEAAHLRSVIQSASRRHPKASLNHGDLRLKNVIVDEDGEIAAIVDWEECLSTIAPQWELSIALHDLSIDEKQEFIDGYGLNFEQIEQMIPLIRAFNIVNYAPAVEAAANSKEGDHLKDFRLRLRGYLDLYCSASL